LATSSKLVKTARQWYEIQDGAVIESWLNLKTELVKMFDRKVLFTSTFLQGHGKSRVV